MTTFKVSVTHPRHPRHHSSVIVLTAEEAILAAERAEFLLWKKHGGQLHQFHAWKVERLEEQP